MNMRESFEKEYPVPPNCIYCADIDSYVHNTVMCITAEPYTQQLRWEAWQKSRAAIVLPETIRIAYFVYKENDFMLADEVKQAIGAGDAK